MPGAKHESRKQDRPGDEADCHDHKHGNSQLLCLRGNGREIVICRNEIEDTEIIPVGSTIVVSRN